MTGAPAFCSHRHRLSVILSILREKFSVVLHTISNTYGRIILYRSSKLLTPSSPLLRTYVSNPSIYNKVYEETGCPKTTKSILFFTI